MLVCDQTLCDVCGTCVSVCVNNALWIDDALHVDSNACCLCGVCAAVCPFGALQCSQSKESDV